MALTQHRTYGFISGVLGGTYPICPFKAKHLYPLFCVCVCVNRTRDRWAGIKGGVAEQQLAFCSPSHRRPFRLKIIAFAHTHPPLSFSRCSTQRHLCELIVDRKTCGLAKHWHAFCQRLKTRRKKLKPPARHIKVSGRHKFMLACNFAQHQHTSLPTWKWKGAWQGQMEMERGLYFVCSILCGQRGFIIKIALKVGGNSIPLGSLQLRTVEKVNGYTHLYL